VPTGSSWLGQQGIDSNFVLSDDEEGEHWRSPRLRYNAQIDDKGVISSEWKPWPDVHVKTWLIPPESPRSGFHVRVHRISTGRFLKTVDAGFATDGQQGAEAFYRTLPVADTSTLSSAPGKVGRWETSGEALAVSSRGVVGVVDLSTNLKRDATVLALDANSHIIFPRPVAPLLSHDLLPSATAQWLVTAVFAVPFGEGTPVDWLPLWKNLPESPSFVQQSS